MALSTGRGEEHVWAGVEGAGRLVPVGPLSVPGDTGDGEGGDLAAQGIGHFGVAAADGGGV